MLSISQEEPYVYPWRPHYYVSVIIATIFYFIPCGVIGLILLIQAQILHATGQAEQAERKREQSKCCTGLAIAAVFIIMVTLLIVFLYPTRDDSYDVDWSLHEHSLVWMVTCHISWYYCWPWCLSYILDHSLFLYKLIIRLSSWRRHSHNAIFDQNSQIYPKFKFAFVVIDGECLVILK